MINAIFAADSQGGLGKNGSLPWPKNSEDLRWFKQNTIGHIVVMGGNTWRDPLMPKPLPDRINIVITSQHVDIEGVVVYNVGYKEQIKKLQKSFPHKDIFIIGGVQLLNDTADLVERVVLTRFEKDYACDIKIDLDNYLKQFMLTEEASKESGLYQIWERVKSS